MALATERGVKVTTSADIRLAWIGRREIALLDVREEAHHAEAHPLFAANLSLSRIELDAYNRLPVKSVPLVVFDDGEGYAVLAADRLTDMGYTDISLLAGGLQGWRDEGYEIFRDVNSPSKAFGELVESVRHTPSLSAQEVQRMIEAGEDIAIVDARRYEEFQTMSIPTAASAPGGELVWRMRSIAPKPSTRVIVNCAGRTRSILGTQSLINAGMPNPVAALRNGTIGWKLAQQVLDHGARRVIPPPDVLSSAVAADAARRVADDAGVRRTTLDEVERWMHEGKRTVYRFDVRTPAEYAAGHLPQFRNAPGGQLVQETDMFAPVRGARAVLADDDGARANMSASWLAQMNWEVYVVDGMESAPWTTAPVEQQRPALPDVPARSRISAQSLQEKLQDPGTVVLDFSRSREYLKAHITGSNFALRSRLREALVQTAHATRYVVTSWEPAAAQLAWRELSQATDKPVSLLDGGNPAWDAAGYVINSKAPLFASEPVDYYRRPYEGTDASAEAMQAYLDWEFGLVDQLDRDGTHGFHVLEQHG
jgi:rhodanese-related sulfurtransferase